MQLSLLHLLRSESCFHTRAVASIVMIFSCWCHLEVIFHHVSEGNFLTLGRWQALLENILFSSDHRSIFENDNKGFFIGGINGILLNLVRLQSILTTSHTDLRELFYEPFTLFLIVSLTSPYLKESLVVKTIIEILIHYSFSFILFVLFV